MLVLTRRINESIVIDGDGARGGRIEIVVARIDGDKVRLGIKAPPDVTVHRAEVQERIDGEAGR